MNSDALRHKSRTLLLPRISKHTGDVARWRATPRMPVLGAKATTATTFHIQANSVT